MVDNRERPPGAEAPKNIDFLLHKAEMLAKLNAIIGTTPDFSGIRGSEDYANLTEEDRTRLEARMAELSGAPVPSSTESRTSDEDDDGAPDESSIETSREAMAKLRKAAELLKNAASRISVDPDYTVLLKNSDFLALSADDQATLRGELGLSDDAGARTAPSARTTEPKIPDAEPIGLLPAKPEDREHAPDVRPLKRRFERYRVASDATGTALAEDFKEWDPESRRYVERTLTTDIPVPSTDRGRFADAASTIRKELDKKQVKLFFDDLGDGTLRPKWKFRLDGRTREIHLTEDDMPEEVMALVKSRPEDYFRTAEWQRWFGPAMQERREAIISETLAERFVPETPPEGERPAIDRSTPKEVDVSMALETLVSSFAPLYDLPKDTRQLVDHLTTFARGVFAYRRERAHKPKEGELDANEVELVHAALRTHFANDLEMSAALDAVFGAPKREESARAAAIRDARSPEELERIIEQLNTETHADAAARDAARQDLLDIEFGRAGARSELRMDGVVREGKARAFFSSHPELDRRNVEFTDGEITVHLDRLRTDEALQRAVRAFMRDAVADAKDESAFDAAVAYFSRLVDANTNGASAAGETFRKGVAALDREAADLTVKDHDRLVSAMRAAYQSIAAGSR